jgi:hypothetical protein
LQGTHYAEILSAHMFSKIAAYISVNFSLGRGLYTISCHAMLSQFFSKFVHCNENQYVTYIIDVISQLFEALFDVELFNEIQGKNSHNALLIVLV